MAPSFNRAPEEAAALNLKLQTAVQQQPLAGSASAAAGVSSRMNPSEKTSLKQVAHDGKGNLRHAVRFDPKRRCQIRQERS